MSIKLTYVLTTFNKLDYLRVTLPHLINACKEDEEIVIVDGGSSDGTKEYLEELFRLGKIHQFISETDQGEAHGTNKAMLLAKGELIKIITDDDAYSFEVIEKCKKFMIENPEIDALGFDGYSYLISAINPEFKRMNVIESYQLWKKNKIPFIFCGLSLLIRKKSLPLLGLFNTCIRMIDFEYTIRITSSNCKIAWYTGLGYVNIANEDSNQFRLWKLSMMEKEKLSYFYLNKLPFITFRKKDSIKEIFRPIKRFLKGKLIQNNQVDYSTAFANAREALNVSTEKNFFLK